MNLSPLHLRRHLRRLVGRTLAGWSRKAGLRAPGPGSSPGRAASPTDDGAHAPAAGTSPAIEQDYPSLDLAYEQGVRSYGEVAERLSVVHSRLDSIQSVVVTLTLAVPTVALAAEKDPDFGSGWLIGAIALALLTVVLGLWARAWSGLILIDPADLYENSLHLSPAEFKKESLYWAGQKLRRESADRQPQVVGRYVHGPALAR